MAAQDLSTDASLLTRIASIESKIRTMCDLIPVSVWGFSSDVHEKLRQRKHRIVNQQLTAKEKKLLTNSKKQQVARTVGGVCRHVSEVIDLLGASSSLSAQPKKVVLSSQPRTEKRNNNADVGNKDKLGIQEKKTPALTRKMEEEGSSDDDSDEKDVRDPTETVTQKKFAKAVVEVANSSEEIERVADADENDTTGEETENVPEVKASKRPASTFEQVQAKKPKFNVESVQCVSKDQSLDVLEQREQAIRKLQEKLQTMKAGRQGKKKKYTDPSAAVEFEQERKLKRRMSKMKMKQRRSEQKLQKTDDKLAIKKECEQESSKDEAVSYSKFDFLVKPEGKKKRLTTSQKKNKFTGRDYKSLLNKAEKRKEKLEKLREKEPERAAEVEEDIKWNRAVNKAQGIKVKDNVDLLRKGLKRKEKLKEKRKESWLNRERNLEREKAKKQEKRIGNLQKRIEDKKKNKLKVLRKKGRIQ